MKNYPPLLVIVGETASGKSSLAMELALGLNGEIIASDSWTTRKDMDIGTAKPNKADRKKVVHHLIDIAEPDEDFTVADFKPLAEKAVESISKKNKLPIMVGGSGLYIDSVLYNYSFLGAGDRQKRELLSSKTIDELIVMIDKLKIKMPANLDRRNKRRLIRLIEAEGKLPSKDKLRPNTLLIGIIQDAKDRKKNVEKRVDAMLNLGLEEEVRSLSEGYGWGCDSLLGVGYRQWQNYFQGQQTVQETRDQIINATLNLAKKQRTWFKRNKSIHWFPKPVNIEEIVELVTTKLSNPNSN